MTAATVEKWFPENVSGLRTQDTSPNALFRAAFVTLRDHLDCEDLVESLVVRYAVERLLVRAAKCDGDEIDRRGDCAEDLAVRRDDMDVASLGSVEAAGRVNCGTV